MTPEFRAWPKIPRWNRDITITEKIDGTNACVIVQEDDGYGGSSDGLIVAAQSRKRIITPDQDNFGFAAWVHEHAEELKELGPGYHYGEWFGKGIQRGYGLNERRFALFNVEKTLTAPSCCDVVPVLRRCTADNVSVSLTASLAELVYTGSRLVPGFMQPEGVVLYHHAANQSFKFLIEDDDQPKSMAA